MMELRTSIQLPLGELDIDYDDSLLLLGSCFAQGVGQKLADSLFRSETNPFGVLYNPASIAGALSAIFLRSDEWREAFCLDERRGLWFNWMADTSFTSTSEMSVRKKLEEKVMRAREFAENVSTVIVTLGTNHVYELNGDGRVVSNCHKMPSSMFCERELGTKECIDVLCRVLEQIVTERPDVRFIFTVSPIRYRKYGFHESNLSKASLLLAVNELQKHFSRMSYFPAYEIVMDELRDYRFYSADMIHPSDVAVDYVWECFRRTYFSAKTESVVAECNELTRMLRHRVQDAESAEARLFEQKIMLKKEQLKRKYPNIAL